MPSPGLNIPSWRDDDSNQPQEVVSAIGGEDSTHAARAESADRGEIADLKAPAPGTLDIGDPFSVLGKVRTRIIEALPSLGVPDHLSDGIIRGIGLLPDVKAERLLARFTNETDLVFNAAARRLAPENMSLREAAHAIGEILTLAALIQKEPIVAEDIFSAAKPLVEIYDSKFSPKQNWRSPVFEGKRFIQNAAATQGKLSELFLEEGQRETFPLQQLLSYFLDHPTAEGVRDIINGALRLNLELAKHVPSSEWESYKRDLNQVVGNYPESFQTLVPKDSSYPTFELLNRLKEKAAQAKFPAVNETLRRAAEISSPEDKLVALSTFVNLVPRLTIADLRFLLSEIPEHVNVGQNNGLSHLAAAGDGAKILSNGKFVDAFESLDLVTILSAVRKTSGRMQASDANEIGDSIRSKVERSHTMSELKAFPQKVTLRDFFNYEYRGLVTRTMIEPGIKTI